MSKLIKLFFIVLVLICLPLVSVATDINPLESALTEGQLKLYFRYRAEVVDEDVDNRKTAYASTLKSRLQYTTKKWQDFQVQIEVDDVSYIGNVNYNNGRNGKNDYSSVLDYNGAEINQAWLSYSGIKKTLIKQGRQTIKLGNRRYISALGWRQNNHSFNATLIQNKSLSDTTFFYANIKDIYHGITDSRISTSSNLYQVSNKSSKFIQTTAYNYKIGGFNNTKGFVVSGASIFSDATFFYEIEIATQEANENSSDNYEANYRKYIIGITGASMTAKVGMEILGGDSENDRAFYTPLGLNHAFNGWADKFVRTPATGLNDSFIEIKTSVSDYKLTFAYHQFKSDEATLLSDYGNEIDVSVAKNITPKVNLLIKYAGYFANDFSQDTNKAWLQFSVNL